MQNFALFWGIMALFINKISILSTFTMIFSYIFMEILIVNSHFVHITGRAPQSYTEVLNVRACPVYIKINFVYT